MEELTYPNLEAGNVFVATKMEITVQARGVCEDPSMRCDTKADCSPGVDATCEKSGLCKEPSWCPKNPAELPEIYKTPTAPLLIWVKSAIQFYGLNKERRRRMRRDTKSSSPKWYNHVIVVRSSFDRLVRQSSRRGRAVKNLSCTNRIVDRMRVIARLSS